MNDKKECFYHPRGVIDIPSATHFSSAPGNYHCRLILSLFLPMFLLFLTTVLRRGIPPPQLSGRDLKHEAKKQSVGVVGGLWKHLAV